MSLLPPNPNRKPSLLVAMPHMQDPMFQRTVILLIDHDDTGAFGFVINRPGLGHLKDMIEWPEEIPEHIPAWFGGPVSSEQGLVLHNLAISDLDTPIIDGVSISAKPERITELIAKTNAAFAAQKQGVDAVRRAMGGTIHSLRFLVGYSGWGAGQLKEELKLGGWIEFPYDASLVFDSGWTDLWETTLRKNGVDPQALVGPVQPYLN